MKYSHISLDMVLFHCDTKQYFKREDECNFFLSSYYVTSAIGFYCTYFSLKIRFMTAVKISLLTQDNTSFPTQMLCECILLIVICATWVAHVAR